MNNHSNNERCAWSMSMRHDCDTFFPSFVFVSKKKSGKMKERNFCWIFFVYVYGIHSAYIGSGIWYGFYCTLFSWNWKVKSWALPIGRNVHMCHFRVVVMWWNQDENQIESTPRKEIRWRKYLHLNTIISFWFWLHNLTMNMFEFPCELIHLLLKSNWFGCVRQYCAWNLHEHSLIYMWREMETFKHRT